MAKIATKKTGIKKAAPKKLIKSKKVVKVAVKKAAAPLKKTIKKKVTTKKTIDTKSKLKKTMTIKKIEKASPKPKKAKTTAPKVQVEIKKKSTAHIKGYSKKELEHFKKVILDKRDEIIEQLQNLKEQMLDPTTGEYINENSPYSLHMAEQGTDAMEREKTFLYAQRENKFLGYLEDALNRIELGTYGICVECIDDPQHLCETCPLIPKARLEAVPHSQLCLPIKQRQEKK
ncbi:MAG: conjugal transfer protein TraR [Ignavibacteriaceae bacterium]|nr:conjugal transfer protein TraR [Ignavibacteriaceae bacterium]